MKNVYKRVMTLISGVALGLFSLSAYTPGEGEAILSYHPDPFNGSHGGFGVGAGDGHFDLAVKIESSVFKGNKIKGVLVPFGDTDFLTNMSAWVSTNLNSDNGDNCRHTPDLAKKSFFFNNENTDKSKPAYAEVLFDEPVTIGDADLYVGYTFWVAEHNSGNDEPLLVYGKAGYPGLSLYVQTEGWPWTDVVAMKYEWSSSLAVILESPSAGVSLRPIDVAYTQAGADTKVPISVFRTGSEKVNSIDYEVLVDGQTNTYHYDVPEGTLLNSGDVITYPAYTFPVTVPKLYDKGEYSMRVTITKVNGKENAAASKQVNTKIRVSEFLPTKRAVLEEATCTACLYCTRGTYAMNVMGRLHPEDCIGIVYHNSLQWGGEGEPMHVLQKNAPFPMGGGNPTLYVDRKYDTADYMSLYQQTTTTFGVEEAWAKAAEAIAPAALEVNANWKDADKEELEVTGTARFTADYEKTGFKMELVLLHDGMHGSGPYWTQRNYYSKNRSPLTADISEIPEWQEIYKAASSIENYHYQEVYIGSASGTALGVENSVPESVKEGDPVSFSHTFKMSELKNLTGKSVVQDKNSLRVVALLIASDGSIQNGAEAKVPGYNYKKPTYSWMEESSVGEIADTAAVITGYYDINGRQVSDPGTGVYIVKYSDGTVRKVLLKK